MSRSTALLLCAISGCSAGSVPAGSGSSPGPGGGPGEPGTPTGERPGPSESADGCPPGGPIVDIPDLRGTVTVDACTGAVAERVFGNAICSCGDTTVAGFLHTRSFDSADGDPAVLDDSGGPVGVNRTYVTSGYADVGGTFVVAGADSLAFAGFLRAGGDLRLGGDAEAAGYIDVARDAWLAGDVTVPGYVAIHRDLHQPAGRSMLTVLDVAGETRSEPFTVAPPCPCAPSEIIDVRRVVADARGANDNAAIGLDPGALANVVGVGVEIELPCGRFYLDAIGGLGGITLRLDGHTAIFVDGDVEAIGALDVVLGPRGELDLFIAGDLKTIGAGSFGDRRRPAASRIYVDGDGEVALTGAAEFVGNLYAPGSRITSIGAAFVHGSIFGREIEIPGALSVVYDRQILEVGDDCGDPDDGCDEPCDRDCPGGLTCVEGGCGECRSDDDCCAPDVCLPDGTCGSLLI